MIFHNVIRIVECTVYPLPKPYNNALETIHVAYTRPSRAYKNNLFKINVTKHQNKRAQMC